MTDTTDLIQRLRTYQQADEEGVIVKVSRQACDEAADAIEQQAAQIEALRADAERMRQLLSDARSAMDYHQEQTRPIHSTRTALEAIDAELRKG